jgi:5-methylcytosine-specific restriction endonuclease McrA
VSGRTYPDREAYLASRREAYQRRRQANLEYAAKYRRENPDKIKVLTRASYQRRKGYYIKWQAENCDRIKANRAAWKAANAEKIKAMNAAWAKGNKPRQHNYRAKRRALTVGILSPDIVQRLFVSQRGRCACCGTRLGESFHLDHIIPIAKGGTNTDENVQLLTPTCNLQKGTKDPIEFMRSRGRLL